MYKKLSDESEDKQKIKETAKAEYNKSRDSSRTECNKIIDIAWKRYQVIKNDAEAEYEKIKSAAELECSKIEEIAWKEYQKKLG
jgi:hypothetical protein